MAISPIQIFQTQQSPLSQILAGGNQTVSNIMDRAIQIGRDISNKQLAQERDLSASRAQQEAMDQRRAEAGEQSYQRTRDFMRGAFESDRNYSLADRRVSLIEEEAEAERRRQAQLDAYYGGKYGDGGDGLAVRETGSVSGTAGTAGTGTRIDQLPGLGASAGVAGGGAAATAGMNVANLFATPAQTQEPAAEAAQPQGDLVALQSRYRELQTDLAGATDQRTRSRIASQLGAVEGQIQLLEQRERESRSDRTTVAAEREGDTPAGLRSQERLEMAKQKDAENKERDTMRAFVAGDTKTFVPTAVWATKRWGTDTSKWPADVRANAAAYDEDPLIAEINFALNAKSEDSYVNIKGMTLNAAQKKKRKRIWNFAKKYYSGENQSAPSGGSGSPVRDLGL